MATTTLIELNRVEGTGYNGILNPGEYTNSNWVNTASRVLKVNPGDAITIKEAFIDIQDYAFTDILIEEDTDISLKFGFYALDDDKFGHTQGGTPHLQGEKLVLKQPNQLSPTNPGSWVFKTWTYTIPAGRYIPGELARIITENMTKSRIVSSHNIGGGDSFLAVNDFVVDAFYDPAAGAADRMYWESVTSDSSQFTYYTSNEACVAGSLSPSLLFSYKNSGKFSLTTHTANRKESGGTMQEFVYGYSYDGTSPPIPIESYCGVWFPVGGMQPREFWRDKLGFEPSNIEVVCEAGAPFNPQATFDGEDLGRHHSGLEISLNNWFAKNMAADGAYFPLGVNTYDFGSTIQTNIVPIEAEYPYQQGAEGGYYLLEINANYNSGELITNEQTFNHIHAIISKQYLSSGFITSYGGNDSISYIHQGLPMLISSFNVRILNPDKTEVTQIGAKNVIFLEVIKNATPAQIKKRQTQSDDKKRGDTRRQLEAKSKEDEDK